MTTWGDLRRWQAGPVESASAHARSVSTGVVDLADELRTMGAPALWQGTAAGVAATRLASIGDRLDDFAAETAAVRRGLLNAADSLTGLARAVAEADGFAGAHDFQIGADGSVTDVSGPVWLPTDQADEYHDQRVRLRDEVVDRVEQALRRALEIDTDLAAALSGALAGRYAASTAGDLAAAAARGDLAIVRAVPRPPADGSPGDNAGWWDSLSDTEKQTVIDEHPEWVGNLDGVPFAARDEANRALLATERDRLLAEKARLEADLADNWFGGTFTNDDARLAEVEAKLASLDTIERTLALGDRYLCTLDLSGERAMAAVAHGNPDTAGHVSVFTPGLSTTVEDDLEGYDADNSRLRQAALDELERNGRGGESVSTISWLGYEAPQNRDGWREKAYDLLFDDDTVIEDGAARRGAQRLSSFYQGIDTSRDTDPHLTALGHSYGSLTTGIALQSNTGVDDAVFFGSPGLGTTDSDDIRVSGQRYYIEARNDFVGDLGAFGTDPTYLDKVNQAYSGSTTLPDGRQLVGVEGHSSYYADQSTSQYNMASVVAGLPDQVVLGSNWGAGDIASWPFPWTHN